MRRHRNRALLPRRLLPEVQEDSALGWHALVLEKPHFCLVQPRRSASKGGGCDQSYAIRFDPSLVRKYKNFFVGASLSALPGMVRVLTEQHTVMIRSSTEPK